MENLHITITAPTAGAASYDGFDLLLETLLLSDLPVATHVAEQTKLAAQG